MDEVASTSIRAITVPPTGKKRILILGGGFAGAYTALHLEKQLVNEPDYEVALIAKENFVLFTPMLHEVAGSDVAVTDIVQPLRKMLRRTRVAIADVEAIDLAGKQIRARHADLPNPYDVPYDQLVLALGAVTNFFKTPGLAEHALTMKTLGDALLVRNRVIDALELADNQSQPAARQITLTVVVAGGGFAGAETVGAVNDFLREGMKFYPHLTEDMLRIVLVHPGEVILPELGEGLGRYAQKKLADRGVEIRVKTRSPVTMATRLCWMTAQRSPRACSSGPQGPRRLPFCPAYHVRWNGAASWRTNFSRCRIGRVYGRWATAR